MTVGIQTHAVMAVRMDLSDPVARWISDPVARWISHPVVKTLRKVEHQEAMIVGIQCVMDAHMVIEPCKASKGDQVVADLMTGGCRNVQGRT